MDIWVVEFPGIFFVFIRRLLTNKTHLPASVELLALARKMFSVGKELSLMEFDNRCALWEDFLDNLGIRQDYLYA